MLTPRARKWAIALGTAALLLTAVLIALPYAVRYLAVQRVEAMTGREVTIADVDLNLFTRRIVFADVRIASPDGAPPLATVQRIEARFQLLSLVRGRPVLDRVAVVEPVVHVARRDDQRLSIEDVIEHWSARPAGEPVQARLDVLTVVDGRVVFADQFVQPAREWVFATLAVEARDITTMSDAATGRLSATFAVAGGTGEVHLTDLRVRPFAAQARVALTSIDVARFDAYLGDAAPIGFAGGRFSTNVALAYDTGGSLRGGGEGTLRDLALSRPAQEQAFVAVPAATLRLDGFTWTGGSLAAEDVVLTAARATVYDGTAARPRPLEVRDLEAAFHDAPVPGPPGRVTLTAALPGNGTLQVEGTGTLFEPAGELTVEMRGIDATLAQVWIPPDAAVMPAGGEVGATLALRYASDAGLRVNGRTWATALTITQAGQSAPLLRDDRVELVVTDFVVDGAGAGFERLRLVASPTITPPGPPAPLAMQDLSVTLAGGRFPGEQPTQVDARAVLPHGGTVTASGQVHVATPTATLTVIAKDLDAKLARPYLPPQAPVAFTGGQLDARLAVTWREALRVNGTAALRALTVQWRAQDAPLVEHATLDIEVTDLVAREGALAVDRVTVTGSPTIVDVTATPPQRFETRRLQLTATDLTWPGRRPMRVDAVAETADGATATLTGTVDLAALSSDVRLEFAQVDVTRARGYIPAGVPLAVEHGQAEGTVRLQHARDTVEIDAEGSLRDVALTLTSNPVVPITEDHVTFQVENLVVKGGRLSVETAVIDGSPLLAVETAATPPVPLRAELRGLVWPGGQPANFTLTAQPGEGRLTIQGTFAPAARTVEASIRAEDAALAPFAPLMPVGAPVAGRVDAELQATVRPEAPAPLTVQGSVTVHAVRLGPEDTAPVAARALRVVDLAIEGRRIGIARFEVEAPSVLIEREQDGSFPLRAMLRPNGRGAASPPDTSTPVQPASAVPADEPGQTPSWRVEIDEIRLTDGAVRFLDRTERPFYSEEITRLEATVRDLSNVDERTAGLTLQGIVGASAALDLRGEVAPFAEPFFLDVSGTLRDFAVPRTNPLLRRFLDWIARGGELTTQVHYRIVGDDLTATNELVIHRLDVQKMRGDDARTERLVGLPIGLVVSLLKDASGTIRFTLPVSGALSSPQFSFGDAIKSALKNVVGRLVTSPFRAIGSVVRRKDGGEVEGVSVNPVTFPAGSAALTPDGASHLQRVADFLRASPYVRLGLTPVVTDEDVAALRAAEVNARIQRVQREQGIDDFAAAARRVWERSVPAGAAPPEDPKAIVRVLAQREPEPAEAARQLAERRASAARSHLVDEAGIAAGRLVTAPEPPAIGGTGEGRVEFSLEGAS